MQKPLGTANIVELQSATMARHVTKEQYPVRLVLLRSQPFVTGRNEA